MVDFAWGFMFADWVPIDFLPHEVMPLSISSSLLSLLPETSASIFSPRSFIPEPSSSSSSSLVTSASTNWALLVNGAVWSWAGKAGMLKLETRVSAWNSVSSFTSVIESRGVVINCETSRSCFCGWLAWLDASELLHFCWEAGLVVAKEPFTLLAFPVPWLRHFEVLLLWELHIQGLDSSIMHSGVNPFFWHHLQIIALALKQQWDFASLQEHRFWGWVLHLILDSNYEGFIQFKYWNWPLWVIAKGPLLGGAFAGAFFVCLQDFMNKGHPQ